MNGAELSLRVDQAVACGPLRSGTVLWPPHAKSRAYRDCGQGRGRRIRGSPLGGDAAAGAPWRSFTCVGRRSSSMNGAELSLRVDQAEACGPLRSGTVLWPPHATSRAYRASRACGQTRGRRIRTWPFSRPTPPRRLRRGAGGWRGAGCGCATRASPPMRPCWSWSSCSREWR